MNLVGLVKKYWVFLTVSVFAVIGVLSLMPPKDLLSVPASDKVHHMVAYAALAFPAAVKRPRGRFLLALLFVLF